MKQLKEGFDDPNLDDLEPTLLREAGLPRDPLYIIFQGEIFHQLALRAERRGEIEKALWRYERSIRTFKKHELLGRARVMRDYGLFLCKNEDHVRGLTYIETALELHNLDIQGVQSKKATQKGERQRRITEGYLWRAQIIVGEGVDDTLKQLIRFALDGCADWSLRDQYFIVSFAREHASLVQHPALDARMLDIYANRGKPLRTVFSIAQWVIDTELVIAQRISVRVIRTIFRKE